MKLSFNSLLLLALLGTVISGCASYTTPGAGVSINSLSDYDINELMSKQPAVNFPANIAVARVQAPGYQTYALNSYGTGRYSVVTTREVESEEDFKTLSTLPQVRAIAPLNKLLLPTNLDSIKVLRQAAARLKTDILMVYSFDTRFHAGEQKFAPLNAILLGFLKNKEVTVTTTVSAAFFDVRTEYLYGIAESTAKQSNSASVWSTSAVVDDLRVTTEKQAFKQLIPEISQTWNGIVEQYQVSRPET